VKARPWRKASKPPADWLDWWQRRGQYELRVILMTGWDPIGVATEVQWSEYDAYLEEIAEALRLGDGAEAIERRLAKVERASMGFDGDFVPRRTELGKVLVAWHMWSYTQSGHEVPDWDD
jgi:hypothetical protein